MKKRNVYKIISHGGIGDALLTTPVFSALKKKDPDCIIKVYCPDKKHLEVYRHNPYIDKLGGTSFREQPFLRAIYLFNPAYIESRYYNNNYGKCNPSKIYEIHASRIIGEMFHLKLHDVTLEVYLTEREEVYGSEMMSKYEHPVIVHTTASCTKNKHWTIEKWEELIRLAPDYTFIQIGLKTEQRLKGAVDFRGMSSIRETMALIKYAKGFVGVESSFAHACNAVGTPGVVLFGPSAPVMWGHKTNINLFKGVTCAPCIDILLSSACPYNNFCMKDISVDEVRYALEAQVKLPVIQTVTI